jgi:putative aldouronate transport system permease protein
MEKVDFAYQRVEKSRISRFINALKKYKLYYLLIAPGMLFYVIFHYIPMFGVIIAFKDVSPFEGIEGIITGQWVGFKHFIKFFKSIYFRDIMANTLTISFYKLLFGFTAPIILALLLNEVRNKYFKKIVQTISYLPHFISMVVVAGLLTNILSTNGGIVNEVVKFFGKQPIYFLGDSEYFRTVLVASGVWQTVGWGSIIYLAAITGIDPQLYEACVMDGGNKWKQVWHITLPGIRNVVVIMLIMNIGGLLNAGFEQILLLYSPAVYDVADIVDTYVYREGLINSNYSFSTAVGVFKSIISMVLMMGSNYIAKLFGEEGIW